MPKIEDERKIKEISKPSPKMVEVQDMINRHAKLVRLDASIRGLYLSQAIALEAEIDEVIASYFCLQKRHHNLFTGLIIKNLDLAKKIKIMDRLANIFYKGEGQDYRETFPDLAVQLHDVRKYRNKLAHAATFNAKKIIQKQLENRIELSYYDNENKRVMVITTKEIDEKIKEVSWLIGQVYMIHLEMTEKSKKQKQVEPSSIELG